MQERFNMSPVRLTFISTREYTGKKGSSNSNRNDSIIGFFVTIFLLNIHGTMKTSSGFWMLCMQTDRIKDDYIYYGFYEYIRHNIF